MRHGRRTRRMDGTASVVDRGVQVIQPRFSFGILSGSRRQAECGRDVVGGADACSGSAHGMSVKTAQRRENLVRRR